MPSPTDTSVPRLEAVHGGDRPRGPQPARASHDRGRATDHIATGRVTI